MFIGQYDTENINFSRRKSAKERRNISLGLKAFWDKEGRKGKKEKSSHTKRNIALALGGVGLVGAGIYGTKKGLKMRANKLEEAAKKASQAKKAANTRKVLERREFLDEEAAASIPYQEVQDRRPDHLKIKMDNIRRQPGVEKGPITPDRLSPTEKTLRQRRFRGVRPYEREYSSTQRKLGKTYKDLAKKARDEGRYFSRYLTDAK